MTEGEGVTDDVTDGLGEPPVHPAVHLVPMRVPPFEHTYTGFAAWVMVQVVPERTPP